MTARTVPEWIGSSPDAAIPRLVKTRIWLRCEGRCAITGAKIRATDPHDFDHIIPLALGGEHREGNLQLVSRAAHREKTADDTRAIRKAQRVHAKHHGYYPKSKRPLKSRGFEKSRAF